MVSKMCMPWAEMIKIGKKIERASEKETRKRKRQEKYSTKFSDPSSCHISAQYGYNP